jgi:acarbose 7IV-phosphotransferase
MQKVFIIGGTTFDHIVYLPQLPGNRPQTIHQAPFQETTGSTGSGKALNLTKLGVPNTLYSVLGNDGYGQQIIAYLQQNGVDFFYDIDPKGTERHINIMDAQGGRISMFITQSSETLDFSSEKIAQALLQADVVILNIIGYCRPLIPLVAQSGKPVWTDLHDYDGSNPYHDDFIHTAQYLHLSSDNLPDYLPLMERWIAAGKELVICTHGKAGATLLTKAGLRIEQPALLDYPLIDANGAGDSFFAGFLYGWLQGQTPERCLQMGAVCAGLCISDRALASAKLSPAYLQKELEGQGYR